MTHQLLQTGVFHLDEATSYADLKPAEPFEKRDEADLPTPLSFNDAAAARCDVKRIQGLAHKQGKDAHITLHRLIAARKIAADIVATHGERFLPYFTRLNDEVKRRERDNDDLALALKIAS